MEIAGRDTISGLPRKIVITSEEIREALREPIAGIIETVMRTLEKAEPEDIYDFTTLVDIITAPGVEIISTIPTSTTGSSSGTSMSTPHVSGVIALLNHYKKLNG